MMCESLGLSDLKEDSTTYVSSWVKRHIWDLPVEVPYVPRQRRLGYVIYAVASGLYSYTVLFIIARFVGNVFRNFDPDWSFIPELLTAAFIFRGRISKLVKFMKLVYLDKRDRVRSWAIFRHPLYVVAAVLIFCLLPLWHESITGRFVLEPQHVAFVRALVPGSITQVYASEGTPSRRGCAAIPDEQPHSALGAGQERSGLRHGRNACHLRAAALLRLRLCRARARAPRRTKSHRECPGCDSGHLEPDFGSRHDSQTVDLLGSHVAEGTELAEVADLANMQARMFMSEYDLHRLQLGAPARLMVDGSVRKLSSEVASIATRSSAIDPALVEPNKFQGLRAPNYYVVDMPIANPEGALKPGMVGTARVYGPRRSILELIYVEAKRGLVRKLW